MPLHIFSNTSIYVRSLSEYSSLSTRLTLKFSRACLMILVVSRNFHAYKRTIVTTVGVVRAGRVTASATINSTVQR